MFRQPSQGQRPQHQPEIAQGDVGEAREKIDALLSRANDVGLFVEEVDPRTGAALGNFPQAFTHIGLINAALTLDRRMRGRLRNATRAEASK